MYSLIVPVLPFTLVNRIGVPEDQVQGWIGVLLALHGVGVVVGSRESTHYVDAKSQLSSTDADYNLLQPL